MRERWWSESWAARCMTVALLGFGSSALAGGGGGLAAAGNFRDSATGVYQQGVDVCGGDCEPELSGAVANLGSTLGPLNAAIASGNPQQIRDAVTNTAATLGSLCTVLRVDCPVPPAGAVQSLDQSSNEAANAFTCSDLCGREQSACIRGAAQQQYFCTQHVNEFVGCRLQTPFCDWRSAPFDASAYSNCRNNAFYRQYLQECRCPVPPGQGERQGGCPDFFTQGVGQPGTSICEVPDGLGCARCCSARCVGADGRLSCRGTNREECDVCEWSRRTILAGASMRSSLCDAVDFRRQDWCDTDYQRCLDSCASP